MTNINPRVDLAFKKIFGSVENKDLLISFINSVVSKEDQVADVELLNPYNPQNFALDKLSILDIKAKDCHGKYYNIEIQISNEADYDKRALYYWAKLYAEQLQSGMGYGKLSKAIGIHVLNFISIPDNKAYHNKFHITNAVTNEHYFKDMEMHTIELSKFIEGIDEDIDLMLPRIRTSLDRWAAFLTRAHYFNKDALPQELNEPYIKKAIDVLSHINLNKQERDFYEGHLKWLMIEENTLEKARSDGKEEGKIEGKIEVAKHLIAKGFDDKMIFETTGLTVQEVKKYFPN